MRFSYPSILFKTCLLLAISLLLSTNLDAQHPAAEQLSQRLDSLRLARGIPGMAVALSKEGETIFSQGFGYADAAAKTPATSETLFRLASVSKLLTIAAIAKLSEQDKLDLHEPIETYIEDFPHAGKGITTKLLCGHLGGIRHYKAKDIFNDNKHVEQTSEALKIFIKDELINAPGTAYRYSTFGFVLLQGVIEGASGMSFLDYLDEEVLTPLEMSRTFPDQKDSLYTNRSSLYRIKKNGKVKVSRFNDPSYKWGGGGMLSTVEDLLRFGEAHLSPGYFSEAMLDSLFHPQALIPRSDMEIGLGWRIGKDRQGRTIYHHAGNMNGARSVLLLYPEEDIVVAIQNNLSNMPDVLKQAILIRDALFPSP